MLVAMAASVRIGEITEHADRIRAAELLATIWRVPIAESPVPADLMTAFGHAGGCVLGAWTDDGALVGVSIGFAGAPASDRLHSYIAGVSTDVAGQGVGRLLKLAQRDWALAQGAAYLVWTYDPLIRRNAHFNLNRLGARVTDFDQDHYPPMLDAVNAGDLPDRFVVEWQLADEPGGRRLPDSAGTPLLLADAQGEPAPNLNGLAGAVLRAWIPRDIEALRRADPELGRRWRLAAREVFGAAFAAGYRPVGVEADGHYVFTQEAE